MDDSRAQKRGGQIGPLGHYWFLTFEYSSELHNLVKECQEAIDVRYFYPVPPDGLHLTLDRIMYAGQSTPAELDVIATAARSACTDLAPFTVTIDQLKNLRGAMGFEVGPVQRVHALRNRLRAATLSVFPEAPVKRSSSNPHVTVAYPVGDRLSDRAVSAAETINATLRSVDVTVTEAVLVALERHQHRYSWTVVDRVPLVG
ncbi:hypothetical protein GFY24_28455 [Nocardia sp. SYP-A9097]|uniref:2'-5' RNA ligase family protein n=1 Tax=Nocardia sp. SYP-A9097 TaxID=2663237 RepID=UPI00129A89BE|nr:2'-5' RNA ligase family protein [Nocardia sp. SYP-A9097]MRH91328.1 hypothetical protein [Nocardia sp. SYP-A9097]